MDIYRIIWGEHLENEMKCDETIDEGGFSHPDSDEFMMRWHSMSGSENTPFVCFYFREGKGWNSIDWNVRGWNIYGESIMGQTKE